MTDNLTVNLGGAELDFPLTSDEDASLGRVQFRMLGDGVVITSDAHCDENRIFIPRRIWEIAAPWVAARFKDR